MRKLLLALSAVLLLASFTNNPNETIILKDIDGTLLHSYVVIDQVNGEYTATFTVDATTIVTSNTDVTGTHINLAAIGSSNSKVTHTVTFPKGNLAFNSYFEGNTDVASTTDMYMTAYVVAKKEKPRMWIE